MTLARIERDNQLHSVRAELRAPSRGPTRESTAAVLIPKLLTEYGQIVAALYGIDEIQTRHFDNLARIEKDLAEYGCKPPRPDLSKAQRAAWRVFRGELP